jgi:hypothetical protein
MHMEVFLNDSFFSIPNCARFFYFLHSWRNYINDWHNYVTAEAYATLAKWYMFRECNTWSSWLISDLKLKLHKGNANPLVPSVIIWGWLDFCHFFENVRYFDNNKHLCVTVSFIPTTDNYAWALVSLFSCSVFFKLLFGR